MCRVPGNFSAQLVPAGERRKQAGNNRASHCHHLKIAGAGDWPLALFSHPPRIYALISYLLLPHCIPLGNEKSAKKVFFRMVGRVRLPQDRSMSRTRHIAIVDHAGTKMEGGGFWRKSKRERMIMMN